MQKRKDLFLAVVIVIAGLMIVTAATCSNNLQGKKAYAVAVEAFTGILHDYNDAYDAASPETQALWKQKVDPKIRAAKFALDGWEVAIGTNSEQQQIDYYKKMIGDLKYVLSDLKVISLEEK